jgi:flagellum-specific ATP synthase
LVTGQRAIDGFLTLGLGQRVGLFAGSGVGKSTLLGEITKYAHCDCAVVALIGERGREVRPFIEQVLGARGLARSVVVVATSDQSPLLRIRAARTAVALASDFRDQGKNVLFVLDSITRLASAQREIGILLREPPTARGYTPSVFGLLTAILEQLGTNERGSITGIISVLVDGDDTEEPISDAVRSIVDGHIVLDRQLAERGHYPAIRISRSLSRVFDLVCTAEHRAAAEALRAAMAVYDDFADMIRLGMYQPGTTPQIDRAMKLMPELERFLCHPPGEISSFDQTLRQLGQLARGWAN